MKKNKLIAPGVGQGTGMGLFIVEGLLRYLGWQWDLKTNKLGGTDCIINIPD